MFRVLHDLQQSSSTHNSLPNRKLPFMKLQPRNGACLAAYPWRDAGSWAVSKQKPGAAWPSTPPQTSTPPHRSRSRSCKSSFAPRHNRRLPDIVVDDPKRNALLPRLATREAKRVRDLAHAWSWHRFAYSYQTSHLLLHEHEAGQPLWPRRPSLEHQTPHEKQDQAYICKK